jgi:hypothetical protein
LLGEVGDLVTGVAEPHFESHLAVFRGLMPFGERCLKLALPVRIVDDLVGNSRLKCRDRRGDVTERRKSDSFAVPPFHRA